MSSNVPYPVSDNRSYAEGHTSRVPNELSYISGPDQALYGEHEYSKHHVYRQYESSSRTGGVSEPQSSLSNVLGHGGVTPVGLPSTGAQNESAGYHAFHPSNPVHDVHHQADTSAESQPLLRQTRPSELYPTLSPSTSTNPHTVDVGPQPQSSPKSPLMNRALAKRKEKQRIELSPDQPLTTQGKPRARVYVACVQCRSRKIRCDGAKPVCHNCTRRSSTAEGTLPECSYDPAPKRRGPDKVPGARQRSTQTTITEGGKVRRRRRRAETTSKTDPDLNVNHQGDVVGADWTNQRPMRMEIYTGNPATAQSHASQKPQGLSLIVTDLNAYKARGADSSYHPLSGGSSNHSSPLQHVSPLSQIGGTLQGQSSSYTPPSQHGVSYSQVQAHQQIYEPVDSGSQYPYVGYVMAQPYASISDEHNEYEEDVNQSPRLSSEPSTQFSRKTWWDALVNLYRKRSNPSEMGTSAVVVKSTEQRIIADLRFIFRASNFWFSFLNITRFFGRLLNPVQRKDVQPSLVLALLALSVFMQSSEAENGATGRAWALELREEAQSALDASLSGRWVDETLVHASWLMSFFEISAHPHHHTDRVRSALSQLDSLLRSMALCSVDQNDPRVSKFTNRTVPSVSPPSQLQSLPPQWESHHQHHQHPHHPTYPSHLQLPQSLPPAGYINPNPPSPSQCCCANFTLGQNSNTAKEWTPLWLTTPTWQDNWPEADIRKEECRRIVWSSMMLTAGHSSYTVAYGGSAQLDLFINNPANYMVLFPGESLMSAASSDLAKETVWALYMRAMLLWHSCVRMRLEPESDDAAKAHFAVGAWLEIDRIEEALSRHTCNIERAFLFQGREFMFNARMVISYEFRRYIPQAAANTNLIFHRQKAEEWLKHQASVAEQVMYGLQTVTGQPNVSLTRRSFFLFWFMSQISRALTLWHCDNSLTIALEMSKTLLQPIEFLMALWPCPNQRKDYWELRDRIAAACHAAGLAPPPAPSGSLNRYVPLA
ncbi:hypothetical protein QCA50_006673 [Cerrena zonata]|uniref:Zn(2)-C6 fungal-type domain-containing protein n=1 Tax=Cerrena zonata TaxID=2478898 RepID=A0AAW0GE42_9APHY